VVRPLRASELEGPAFLRDELAKLVAALTVLAAPVYIETLGAIAASVVDCIRSGGKVMFCGNGGSAADAQHLAAELVGRQNFDRPAAAGLALTIDPAALTALANDYGYEAIFVRQVEALGRPGDLLIGLSTSGRSANVVRAQQRAKELDILTVAFTGQDPRDLASADHVLAVPSAETAKIQELHMACGHAILALAELTLFPADDVAESGGEE